MKISFDWLKRYVDMPSSLKADDLALKLTMSTVEVDEVLDMSKDLKGIIVGKVMELKKHPNADKLKLAVVDTGGDKKQVVCGGINLKKGMKVIFAPVGTMVRWHGQGEPVKLEKAKIRGEISEGMICASNELGLEEVLPYGDMEITDLSKYEYKVGESLAVALGLDDIIFDIENKSLSHRPDLWSHVGIAREVAAILGKKLKEPKINKIEESKDIDLQVQISDRKSCPRYIGVAISGIKIESSPEWMQKLLLAAGMRPINNIVDITNFVMLEMGQPLHAFDIKKIIGKKIIVKKASEGQKFTTLDGQKRKLSKDDLLINDSRRAVALAGVMGGANSEVKKNTKTIILESANFDPVSIRKISTRHGLRTEASTRFEKALDPALAEKAALRAVNLILEIIPTAKVASKFVDINYSKKKKVVINLELEKLNKIMGEAISAAKVRQILTSLQFKVKGSGKKLKVEVPSFRAQRDITIQEDLIEEVARVYGFNNVKTELPKVKIDSPPDDPEKELEQKIKYFLTDRGFDEVRNYSFINPTERKQFFYKETELVELQNNFSEEQRYLRSGLVPKMIKNVELNLRFFSNFKIFEIGRVYKKNQPGLKVKDKTNVRLPYQPKRLTAMLVQKNAQDLFFKVKGVVEALMNHLSYDIEFTPNEHPWVKKGTGLGVAVNKKTVGFFYVFNQSIYPLKAEVGIIDFNLEELAKLSTQAKIYQAMPEYPEVKRDLAIVVGQDINWQDIKSEVENVDKLIRQVSFLSYFKEKNSLAFSITFRADSRTLESKEVDQVIEKILSRLSEKFRVKLR